ncbi:MAG TPA: cation:proton antiporter [Bdellovibrionales bacterium]|nr:cation:proton antiporter [Bdellovibrionales bacterium]
MHLPQIIIDLAVILAVAGVVSIIFQRIRQPLVLGYIVAGFLVGPHTPPFSFVSDLPNIQVWAEIGVVFLMFSLGLEFSFRRLLRVGVSAGVTATLQVGLMGIGGAVIARLLGWTPIESLFFGAMTSISSTTIIIKALDELRLKSRRFAEMILGILIVEDLYAILILVGFSTALSGKEFSGLVLLQAAGKLFLIVGAWFFAGYMVVPRLIRQISRLGTDETLLIMSTALCLGLVVFAAHFDYSIALGAFIMGSILAESSESHRIEELIKPLRDIFGAVFFVSVGMMLNPSDLWNFKGTILLTTAFVIVGNMLINSAGALLTGQTLRTAVQVGMGLGQIGEFSFIIVGLGLSLGVVSRDLYSVAVATSLLTAFTTPYMIKRSHSVAIALENRMPPGLASFLNRYMLYWEQIGREQERRAVFYRALIRWFLNALVVTIVTIICAEALLPLVQDKLPWPELAGWSAALLLTAPFIWAMFTSFSRLQPGQTHEKNARFSRYNATVFFSRLITIAWLGILSLEFFSAEYAALVTFVALAVFSFLFYRRLEDSYHWFEEKFLKTFEKEEPAARNVDIANNLAPWDAHLVRLKVHPNAEIAGRTLQDIQLRNKYGVSVVAVRRGRDEIVAPMPEFMLFPQDELFVLGTDEQIEQCRPMIDKADPAQDFSRPNFELRSYAVGVDSPFARKSIRNARIRDDFHAMVVGIQRGEQRIISPDSDLQLNEGDIIWLVGSTERLDQLDRTLKT